MESVCQIKTQYIFQIISQDEKSTTYTKNMQKVLKEMVILLHIHILQGYGRNNSTMFVFLRRQGWGFVVHVLLLNKKGINVKGKKEVCIHNIFLKIG
jgi:hypothetical protein